MHEALKPCQFRQVDNQGRILCGLIKGGDREVSVNLCRGCAVPQINCQNLRATIEKRISTPITVRFATGRVEVWDDEPPAVEFRHAACVAKTMPIHSPRDCAGCPIRIPNVVPQGALIAAHRSKAGEAAQAGLNTAPPMAAAPAQAAPPARSRRGSRTAQPPAPSPAPPVAQAAAHAAAPAPPPAQTPRGNGAMNPSADELVQRARAAAARQAEQRATRAQEQAAQTPANLPRTGNRSKIILLQQWLADQMNRQREPEPATPPPDAEGVSEIVYTPNAAAYQEEPGMERCVGWTD